MPNITFSVSSQNIARITNAFRNIYPIPQIPVDPEDPTKGTKDSITPEQWAKECLRQWVISRVAEFEIEEAKKVISVAKDENLLT